MGHCGVHFVEIEKHYVEVGGALVESGFDDVDIDVGHMTVVPDCLQRGAPVFVFGTHCWPFEIDRCLYSPCQILASRLNKIHPAGYYPCFL